MDTQIEIKRETEFYQGFIRLKISISNKTPSVVTDVTLDFIFEDNLIHIDHYEPKSYEIKNSKIVMGNINVGTSKSIAVYFDPLMCTGETEISCQVNFRDAQGELGSVFMERKIISVLCPILKTESDINVGRLKELIESLPSRDSKIYEIHDGFDINKMASIAREVIEKHDVRHVRTLKTKEGRECEIWYYGRTKIKKSDIVIKISISLGEHLLELFAATESVEVLTGLLAELGRDLKDNIETRADGKNNNVNVTIRRSMVQRSNLLDLCNSDGTCPVNIFVEDSVVLHTNLMSRIDENGEEKKTRKEELKQKNTEEQKTQEKQESKQTETAREVQGTKQQFSLIRKRNLSGIRVGVIGSILGILLIFFLASSTGSDSSNASSSHLSNVSSSQLFNVSSSQSSNLSSSQSSNLSSSQSSNLISSQSSNLISSQSSNLSSSQQSNVSSSQPSNVKRDYFQQVKYNSNAWKNQEYSSVRVGDKYYVPLKPNSSTIAELIRDDGDEHTLKIGSKLPLGKGYSLEAKQVDVNGEKVWLELDKEGGYVDENIISTDGDATWNCKLDNIQGENKVPVLRVHIKQISLDAENNDITIDGLWLIDYANASSYTG